MLLSCLPPHITHKSQPLDCMVFSPLNAQWRVVFHDFYEPILEKVITKFNFALFCSGLAVVFVNEILGFQTCGVYPHNVSAICCSSSTSPEF